MIVCRLAACGADASICGLSRPGAFSARWLFLSPLRLLNLSFIPSTRLPLRSTSQALFFAGSLLLSLLCLLKFLIYSLRRAQAARGPLLSGQQKVGKDWPKRAAPPLGFPLRSRWRVLRTQFARGRGGTRRRFAAKGFRARFAEALPQMLWRARTRSRPSSTARKLQPRKRRGVPPSPRAVVPEGHSSATASGRILKGAKGPLEPALLLTFLQEQKSKGPRAA